MVFVYSILGGMACAFVFDIFRIIRRVQKKISAVQVFVQDIIFFILFAVILFITILYANDSNVRGYEFFGTLLGAVIYFVVISRIVTKVILFMLRILRIIFERVIKILFFPLVLIFRIFKRPSRFIVIKLGGAFRSTHRKLQNMVYYAKNIFKKIFVISSKV